jgi:hypothetical protein
VTHAYGQIGFLVSPIQPQQQREHGPSWQNELDSGVGREILQYGRDSLNPGDDVRADRSEPEREMRQELGGNGHRGLLPDASLPRRINKPNFDIGMRAVLTGDHSNQSCRAAA